MCRCKEQAAYGAELDHGSDYQRARQQYLRTLAADPNQPRYVRGWATQEANRLARAASARSTGQRGPGGDPYRYKGVPGYDVGHKLGMHGQHAPANFRLEWARDNRARPGHARSLGVQHKWRELEQEFEAELEAAAQSLTESELRGQAGRYPIRHLRSTLRQQGFLASQHFLDRLRERALSQGKPFDPASFRRDFQQAAHYRQGRAGYNTRVADVHGVPVLYRQGGRTGKQTVLVGVLPQLPPQVERVRAPPQREVEGVW